MIVELNNCERSFGEWVGKQTALHYIKKDKKLYNQKEETLEADQIQGSLGEMAGAKAINRYWEPTVYKSKPVDILPDIQIRTTKSYGSCLMVRKKDDPSHRFIGVRQIDAFKFEILGWMLGKDAMKEEFLADKGTGEAYFIPREKLNKIEEFK